MLAVKKFLVGPILGDVRKHEIKVFGKVDAEELPNTNLKQNICWIRYWEKGKQDTKSKMFRVNREFDYTGVIELQDLADDTVYEYQAGWVEEESANEATLDWNGMKDDIYSFKSGDKSDTGEVSFVLGSCAYRHYLPAIGDKMAGRRLSNKPDKSFKSIMELHRKEGYDFAMFLGDQIYADAYWQFFEQETFSEYVQLYQDSFSQEHFADMAARIPLYMGMDDHEIENDYPAHVSWYEKNIIKKVIAAIKAYKIYQLSYSPAMVAGTEGFIKRDTKRLWYKFRIGRANFFVMDCRNERRLGRNARRMISHEQMNSLCNWLEEDPDKIKFVGSSVPFFPDERGGRANKGDKWLGFNEQRSEIIEHIRDNNIRHVVFLSGDVHSSFISTLKMNGADGGEICIHSVISSPLYWPVNVLYGSLRWEKEDVVLAGTLTPGSKSKVPYYVRTPSPEYFVEEDNFTEIRTNKDELIVTVYGRARNPINSQTLKI